MLAIVVVVIGEGEAVVVVDMAVVVVIGVGEVVVVGDMAVVVVVMVNGGEAVEREGGRWLV